MRRLLCAVRDRAAECYGPVVSYPAAGLAVRQFIDEVNRKADDNPLNRHPSDFSLWHLADFDDSTGEITVVNEKLSDAVTVLVE